MWRFPTNADEGRAMSESSLEDTAEFTALAVKAFDHEDDRTVRSLQSLHQGLKL